MSRSWAYYNEFDHRAAAWLRELIRVGLIAPGEVDERSIEDVVPNELHGFTQCHFFAGVGVWPYALRCAGWPDDRPAWTGSCPCQPFSAAGKGDGFTDERHLWPAFHHLIANGKPAEVPVFGEQVASKDGLAWLDLVQADMEAAGHAFWPVDLCSAGFGAPHIRQRLYWVADPLGAGCGNVGRGGLHRAGETGAYPDHSILADGVGYTGSQGSPFCKRSPLERAGRGAEGGAAEQSGCASCGLGNTCSHGVGEHPGELHGDEAKHEIGTAHSHHAPVAAGPTGGVADSQHRGQEDGQLDRERAERGDSLRTDATNHSATAQELCIFGGLADTESGRCGELRDEAQQGCGGYVDSGSEHSRPGPTNGFWRNPDWLYCQDGKWRPVRPGSFPLAHGTSARVGRLRGYGNGLTAQVAQAFVEAYMQTVEGL